MESAAARQQTESLRRQSIHRQIAQLQAQLFDPGADAPPSYAHAPAHASRLEDAKRKRKEAGVLAPASPQHKKPKLAPVVVPAHGPIESTDEHRNASASMASGRGVQRSVVPLQPGPSNVLSKLSAISKRPPSPVELDAPLRTSSFADKASGVQARDDRLMLIEELKPGPYEHKPLFDDPLFERFEPHSGIRLVSRKLSHEDLQSYMDARYYISPSKLYSVVRAQPCAGTGPRGQVYDVPVFGDWVTIAVVAERSPVRISRAAVSIGPGEARDADDTDPTATSSVPLNTRKPKPGNIDPPPLAGRKYVNLTLIDFGAGNKKSTSRGDAVLSLLLFESDTYDTVSRGDGFLPEKIYKGGSRGAFEAMAKLREGSVIALLNPRVLKPLQKPGAPNMLALTPESAGSVAIIGTARDLGMCGVVKRDGKPCGSWCDKRVSEVCEYHVQHALERRRAARPEFSSGTSGMDVGSTSQKRKKTAGFDPQRKWGLAPASGPVAQSSSEVEGATYVVAGHVVAAGKRDLFVNESVGREAQARAARRAGSRDTDMALRRLLARDKEGMKAVREAYKFAKKAIGKPVAERKVPRQDEASDGESESGFDDEECESRDGNPSTERRPPKNGYSAQVIKELGFDPALKSSLGGGRCRKDDVSRSLYSELRELASCREPDRIKLGPRPGGPVRSVVSAPRERENARTGTGESGACFGKAPSPEGHGMVDLDESSDG
ncbi:hypothetical protein F5148DRAFT_1199727 [Russula earlei]|uniref:Uncharacterized protein n=1 Tax=Russula earlei TaxID=71964 RepID=A0ACC0U9D8_9AGAM|nr:hypothetical protein F5148DRAFT_1199727 [Russula earlei]